MPVVDIVADRHRRAQEAFQGGDRHIQVLANGFSRSWCCYCWPVRTLWVGQEQRRKRHDRHRSAGARATDGTRTTSLS